MNNQYNVWNKWDPLKTVMLGDCYGPEFFRDIKNNKIRSALTQIADETKEDLAYFENVLNDFGCQVLRPKLDSNDNIFNYINEDGAVNGTQGVPGSPLQPRNSQLVIGNKLFYTGYDHKSIFNELSQYNKSYENIGGPIDELVFNRIKGDGAPNWPSYDEYLQKYFSEQPISDIPDIQVEFQQIHNREVRKCIVPAPSITVVGKDVYIDSHDINTVMLDYHLKEFQRIFPNFRINSISVGGHNDGCFHTISPGAIISLHDIQKYDETFPGWDICYLPDQSWEKVDGFLQMKNQVKGKWWVPGQERNDEFTNFVETWLHKWVGYVEETVFDVNVLVLDEHHVCISNMNPTVIDFLKKHNMEPVHVPWKHRYFWDGGLHCITLDLYREGNQENYFPNRKNSVTDIGLD